MKSGKAFVFAPSQQLKVGTYSMDAEVEQQLYDLGVQDFEAQKSALAAFLNK